MKKSCIIFISFIIFSTMFIAFIFTDNGSKKENEVAIKKGKDNSKHDVINSDKESDKGPSKIELIKASGKSSYKATTNKQTEKIYPIIETYTIYFDYNGGNKGVGSKNVIYQKEYGNLPIAIRDGYTFDGWYTKRDGGEKIESTTVETKKSNHTLYAHYNINNYLITYDYNYLENSLYKKTADKSLWSIDDFEVLTNDEMFLNENIYKFNLNSESELLKYNENLDLQNGKTYTFSVYIKTNNEKEMLIGFLDDPMKIKTGSTWQRFTKTFVADDKKYDSFIFDLCDNFNWNDNDTLEIYGLMLSEGNLNISSKVKKYGDYLGEPNNPTREGYIFDGWYTDLTFKEKINSDIIVESNKCYYAKWNIKTYTLEINAGDGEYENSNSNKKITQSFYTVKKIEKPKSNYKITYNLNNTGASNTKNEDIIDRKFKNFTDKNNKKYNNDYYVFNENNILTANYEESVNAKIDSISKNGYDCSWNTKSDGTGIKYQSASTIKVNSDITLYANCTSSNKFRKPINTGCITSEYGNRIHPIYGTKKFHSGLDMAGNDKNIYPIANGVVARTGSNSSMGNYIVIHHNINGQNYTSSYYHLELKYVKKGQTVLQNTVIGKMGQTGAATGVHLHLTMYKGHLYNEPSTMVNPRDYISFPSKLYSYW